MNFLRCRWIGRLAYFRVLHHDATLHSSTTLLNIQAAIDHLKTHIRDPQATGNVCAALPHVQACCFDNEATGDVDTISLDPQCAG